MNSFLSGQSEVSQVGKTYRSQSMVNLSRSNKPTLKGKLPTEFVNMTNLIATHRFSQKVSANTSRLEPKTVDLTNSGLEIYRIPTKLSQQDRTFIEDPRKKIIQNKLKQRR